MAQASEIFGHHPETFKSTCVLTPYLFPELLNQLGIMDLKRGFPFSSGSSDKLTLVVTGMGATLAGDATLLLKGSPCTSIVFVGSCGAVTKSEKTQPGSIIQVSSVYHLESFSGMLEGHAQPSLTGKPLPLAFNEIPPCVCCSVGSMSMEYLYLDVFRNAGIEVVDLETSAIVSAAQRIGAQPSALLYVSDVIDPSVHPFISGRTNSHRMRETQRRIIESLKCL